MAVFKEGQKLTKKQKDLLPVYRDRWEKIALDTSPCNRGEAQRWISKAYVDVEDTLKPPSVFYWAKSPIDCLYVYHALTKTGKERNAILDGVVEEISGRLKSAPLIKDQTRNEVFHGLVHVFIAELAKKEYGEDVFNEVRTFMEEGTVNRAMTQIGLWSGSLMSAYLSGNGDRKPKYEVDKNLLDDAVAHFQCGNHDAMLLASFDYLLNVAPADSSDLSVIESFIELSKHCGWYLAYNNLCIASERPAEIHVENGNLHRDGGAALTFKDGFSIWALNGVRVTREIAETPWNKLDPHLIQTEENAEVRNQIVKKIGIERVCKKLKAKVIDKKALSKVQAANYPIGVDPGKYELLMLKMRDGRETPWLKMPSLSEPVGIYRVEGVPPGTKTVDEALSWRGGGDIGGEPLFGA